MIFESPYGAGKTRRGLIPAVTDDFEAKVDGANVSAPRELYMIIII